MVLYSIWLQLRARQDFLGSTLLSGPVNKESKITYVPTQNLKNLPLLHSRFFYPATPIVFFRCVKSILLPKEIVVEGPDVKAGDPPKPRQKPCVTV